MNLALFNVDTPNRRPIKVEVQCGGNPLEMEIDTGAAVSIISQSEINPSFISSLCVTLMWF